MGEGSNAKTDKCSTISINSFIPDPTSAYVSRTLFNPFFKRILATNLRSQLLEPKVNCVSNPSNVVAQTGSKTKWRNTTVFHYLGTQRHCRSSCCMAFSLALAALLSFSDILLSVKTVQTRTFFFWRAFQQTACIQSERHLTTRTLRFRSCICFRSQ